MGGVESGLKAGDTRGEEASAANAFCCEELWIRLKRRREVELRAGIWGVGVVLRMRAPDNLLESVVIIRSRIGEWREIDDKVGIAVLVSQDLCRLQLVAGSLPQTQAERPSNSSPRDLHVLYITFRSFNSTGKSSQPDVIAIAFLVIDQHTFAASHPDTRPSSDDGCHWILFAATRSRFAGERKRPR